MDLNRSKNNLLRILHVDSQIRICLTLLPVQLLQAFLFPIPKFFPFPIILIRGHVAPVTICMHVRKKVGMHGMHGLVREVYVIHRQEN